MKGFPDRDTVNRIRARYPPGTIIELAHMEDEHAPPPGTIGEVLAVDDAGQLVMKWRNGSGLNVIPNVDEIRKLE